MRRLKHSSSRRTASAARPFFIACAKIKFQGPPIDCIKFHGSPIDFYTGCRLADGLAVRLPIVFGRLGRAHVQAGPYPLQLNPIKYAAPLAINGRRRPVTCEQSIRHCIKSILEPPRQQVGPIPIICFFDGQADDQYSCPDVHAARLGEGFGLVFGRVDLPARSGHAVEYDERRVAALLELVRDNVRQVLGLQLHSFRRNSERALAERGFAFEDVDVLDSGTAWCQMSRKRSTRSRAIAEARPSSISTQNAPHVGQGFGEVGYGPAGALLAGRERDCYRDVAGSPLD